MNLQNKKTCLICGRNLGTQYLLGAHIKNVHKITFKEYYDRYIKSPNEGTCSVCGKKTHYRDRTLASGKRYSKYCSPVCASSSNETKQKRKMTSLRRYGVSNPVNTTKVKQKISETVKRTKAKVPKEQRELSLLKRKKTNRLRFGANYPVQNPEIFRKCMKNQMKHKKYVLPSGQTILTQGFEPNFLDFVLNNSLLLESDIEFRPPRIRYTDSKSVSHFYYPDFFIPKFNLIVEIKSSWTIITDKNLELKKRATIREGYEYILVLNNNFSEIATILSTSAT